MIQSLERRTMLSASLIEGTLQVNGTEHEDVITVVKDKVHGELMLIATVNGGKVRSFPARKVLEISVQAGKGDDHVDVDCGDIGAAIDGGKGDDLLDGGAGDDDITGGKGDDTLLGDAGDDNLRGDADNDSLDGGTGIDFLYGAKGDDLFDVTDAEEGEHVDTVCGGSGNDSTTADGPDYHWSAVHIDDVLAR
jgi:Ca2+-binding RTX toxin-like protein